MKSLSGLPPRTRAAALVLSPLLLWASGHTAETQGPLAARFEAVLAGEQARLAALTVRFEATTDPAEALAVQRGIEEVKREAEISLLRIQAKHARVLGRVDAALEIEAAIEAMRRPGPGRGDRPALPPSLRAGER